MTDRIPVTVLPEGGPQRHWKPGERRCSRLVFIGRNLDRDALQAGLDACATAPPALETATGSPAGQVARQGE